MYGPFQIQMFYFLCSAIFLASGCSSAVIRFQARLKIRTITGSACDWSADTKFWFTTLFLWSVCTVDMCTCSLPLCHSAILKPRLMRSGASWWPIICKWNHLCNGTSSSCLCEFTVFCICVSNQQKLQSVPLEHASASFAWPHDVVRLLLESEKLVANHDMEILIAAWSSMCRSECNTACERLNHSPVFVGWGPPSPPRAFYISKPVLEFTTYLTVDIELRVDWCWRVTSAWGQSRSGLQAFCAMIHIHPLHVHHRTAVFIFTWHT